MVKSESIWFGRGEWGQTIGVLALWAAAVACSIGLNELVRKVRSECFGGPRVVGELEELDRNWGELLVHPIAHAPNVTISDGNGGEQSESGLRIVGPLKGSSLALNLEWRPSGGDWVRPDVTAQRLEVVKSPCCFGFSERPWLQTVQVEADDLVGVIDATFFEETSDWIAAFGLELDLGLYSDGRFRIRAATSRPWKSADEQDRPQRSGGVSRDLAVGELTGLPDPLRIERGERSVEIEGDVVRTVQRLRHDWSGEVVGELKFELRLVQGPIGGEKIGGSGRLRSALW